MESSMEAILEPVEPSMVTIGAASKMTGRSASTIRRLVHSIVEKDMHKDRASIFPSPEQVKIYKEKGENFAWRIHEELLMREFERAQNEEKKNAAEPSVDILSILKKELDTKNDQIQKQWEIIGSLNERLREGNILMGALQKRLSLPSSETILDAESVRPSTEASMKASKKASKGAPQKKSQKKGLFSWMGF